MSRNPLVSRVQEAPYKSLKDVVTFWVDVNKSSAYSGVATKGTVATSTYVATLNGATTTIVEFFQDKQRPPNNPRPADTDINP